MKLPRLIIVDEMPDFENSSTFDIGENDNCINWFDSIINVHDIAANIKMVEVQNYRKLFNGIFNSYTYDETTDKTKKLLNDSMPEEEIALVNAFYEMVDNSIDIYRALDINTLTDFINFKRLSKFSDRGVIIVTDRLNSLRELEKNITSEVGYYSYDDKFNTPYCYILESWNKHSY